MVDIYDVYNLATMCNVYVGHMSCLTLRSIQASVIDVDIIVHKTFILVRP